MRALLITTIVWYATLASSVHAAQVAIDGPPGSGEFGYSVTTLPNGNIVVTDPSFDAPGPIADVGAVHLYGPTGGLISTLRGGSAGDQVGYGGVVVLTNGNFVVLSTFWRNGGAAAAGAATFGLGTSGVSGVVSSSNSLVGSTFNDQIGSHGVTALANGNYVVISPVWDNGAVENAGAVTFGSGTGGISGVVAAANSLVGSTRGDLVGLNGVTALANGNYVVGTPSWRNGDVVDAGAVTFGSGTTGISGVVSSANSLVSASENDRIGSSGVTALANGNYVVLSPVCDSGQIVNAGAVTFGSGTTGISGVVSLANSLVGSSMEDRVGTGVIALANGNYVVGTPLWDGSAVDAGAATFGSGTTGISGVVSTQNSLVGSSPGDQIGSGATALTNGNYVVISPSWRNGPIGDAGAVTFGSGSTGISGIVSQANSLFGGTQSDRVGSAGVIALTNGNYVVATPGWDDELVTNGGAATFGSGITGIIGPVTPANSLVGRTSNDAVGSRGATALSNGNYVVRSPSWHNGQLAGAGAATFGSGATGVVGAVSLANSLVGSALGDSVSDPGVTALNNGSYVVASVGWDNGAIANVGAVTYGSGTIGITGVASSANSLVGSTAQDRIGTILAALANGNYVVRSIHWSNGAIVSAGAVTLGLADGSVAGAITTTNSVVSLVADAGFSPFGYDVFRNQLAVGQWRSNRMLLHRTGLATTISMLAGLPDPSISGQPVIFTATVRATSDAPTNGQVTFTASSSESCVDTTPTPTSATSAEFSCAMSIVAVGTSTVIAEYTGSVIHAYSGSEPETHTTIGDVMFSNGFESP